MSIKYIIHRRKWLLVCGNFRIRYKKHYNVLTEIKLSSQYLQNLHYLRMPSLVAVNKSESIC